MKSKKEIDIKNLTCYYFDRDRYIITDRDIYSVDIF